MNADIAVSPKPCPPVADTHAKRLRWWMELEPQWRAAFSITFFRHANQPAAEELEQLWQATALRFAGPRAPYPNLNFELTNCSGLAGMCNLEVVVMTHHRIEQLDELTELTRLKGLFVNNNVLQSLHGIEPLLQLEQLYAQINQLTSIEPIRALTQLREVYVSLNALNKLDGLTRTHAANLKQFFCLPNEGLTDKETMAVERKLGIRCRSI